MAVTIGIDVGGTKIAGGVVDQAGTIIASTRIPTDSADPGGIVTGIVKVGRELLAAAPAVSAVGVGAAGLIDASRGVVLSAPNLAWRNVALGSMLEDRLGLPVAVDNDANVAALAEALYGAGRDAGDQVTVTLGTGVGGGIIIDGRIYRGARGVGAEIGHMVIGGPSGPPCGCGNRGCLEALASGTAMGRMARERAGEPAARAVLEAANGSPDAITGEIVGAVALSGDPFACEVLAEAGRWLGLGLGSLVNLLDPAVIIVGGGAAAPGELILGPARAAMTSTIIGVEAREPPPVVPAALGADAGVVGAAVLALARR